MKKIILIDFSKVLSPIGISRHIAKSTSEYLSIDQESIRNIYKKNIGKLVVGEYSIFDFVDEIEQYIKPEYQKKDLKKAISKIPKIDHELLKLISILKQDYDVYLISDTYKELGENIRKKLHRYFNGFIFSYEEHAKKSQKIFWEKIKRKIRLENCILFIDDKSENIHLAQEYGIDGVVYNEFSTSKNQILEKLYVKYDNILLGAGASGILYGYFLQQHKKNNFILLEKEPHSLGLMKSYQLGNSYYDLGGHALHDNNKKIINFLTNQGGVHHYRQKREAYIDYKNTYIPFPFQLHLNYLNEKEKKLCFSGFMRSYLEKHNYIASNLDDFLLQKFGQGIYNSFLQPYNLKIWKTPLKNISTNWKNRISYEDINTFLEGYLTKNSQNFGTNNFVNYPVSGGYQKYLDPFYNSISDQIQNNTKIFSIDTKNKIIFTNHGKIIYNNIISTIPLNELLILMGEKNKSDAFEYLSLQIVAILTNKVDTYMQRIYQKEKKYHFHKCVINSNSSESMKQNNETVFQFENSFIQGKKINKKKLIQNSIDFLLEKKLISSKNDIIKIDYKEVEYGYPIQTINMIQGKKIIQKKCEKNSIYLLGRFGNWDYINFDSVILNTLNLFNKKENENIIL